MKISAVVPVYNNQTTVAHVVNVLKKHPKVSEVIVVDDGSRDKSPEIVSKIKGIKFIVHPKNMGKGAAVVTGWNKAKHDIILAIDADMSRLNNKHINDMVNAYEQGKGEMIIGFNYPNTFLDWVSGQRIYRKSDLQPYVSLVASLGNGIEQIINFAYRDKKVGVVDTKNIGHVLKHERYPISLATWMYLREGWQIAKTEYILRYRWNKKTVKKYISKDYYQKTIVLAPRRAYNFSKKLYLQLSSNF